MLLGEQILLHQSSHHTLHILHPVTSCFQSHQPALWRHVWNYLNTNRKWSWGQVLLGNQCLARDTLELWLLDKKSALLTNDIWFTIKMTFGDDRRKEFLLLYVKHCPGTLCTLSYLMLTSSPRATSTPFWKCIWRTTTSPMVMKGTGAALRLGGGERSGAPGEADTDGGSRVSGARWDRVRRRSCCVGGQRAAVAATPHGGCSSHCWVTSLSVLAGQLLRWFPALSLFYL